MLESGERRRDRWGIESTTVAPMLGQNFFGIEDCSLPGALRRERESKRNTCVRLKEEGGRVKHYRV